MAEEHYWVSRDGLPWVEVTAEEWIAAEREAGFNAVPGGFATRGFSSLGGKIQGRILTDPAITPRYAKSREQLIEECAQRGQHIWHLMLDPAKPDVVQVFCYWCPAVIDDIWPGAADLIHMQMGDFTVVDGRHTAARVVDMPLDIRLHESYAMVLQTGQLEKQVSVEVTPRLLELTDDDAPGTGTGWCAPSP